MGKSNNPNLVEQTKATRFSKDRQPSDEARLRGARKIMTVRKLMIAIKEKIATSVKLGDENIDLSYEAKIVHLQMENALTGDLKSAEFMAKIGGWFAPDKVANTDIEGNDKLDNELALKIIEKLK
jgi:hypothetical protein